MGKTEFRINILVLVIPPVMLIVGCLKEYTTAFFSIVLHEMCHIAVARRYGIRPSCICITPAGLSVEIQDGSLSQHAMLWIYVAGPASNLILFGVSSLAAMALPQIKENFDMVSATNLLLALFNLLPALPLDGGRILQQILSGSMGLLAAGRVIRILARIISAFLLLAGIVQLYMTGNNMSLIIIGIYIPLVIKDARMESAFMNIRQILYRRSKLYKNGVYPARNLVVLKSTRVDEILKNLDFDRFHIIHVLDDDLCLAGVFTENEIMNVFAGDGDNLTFGQMMQKGDS